MENQNKQQTKSHSLTSEFIPYEQALELKELGFKEPCFFAFDNCSTPMRCTDLRTSEQRFNGVNYNSSTYTSQPTFSQAFRWFRENDYINHVLYDNWTFTYAYEIDGKYHTQDSNFIKYEDAELACLNKLIEIVKQKP